MRDWEACTTIFCIFLTGSCLLWELVAPFRGLMGEPRFAVVLAHDVFVDYISGEGM